MKAYLLPLLLAAFFEGDNLLAVESATKAGDMHETVKATYEIDGLHCPACTRTVEDSLKAVEGIRSIKVHWKSKIAQIEFEEAILPTQKVTQLIADTPHRMGNGEHYTAWLMLRSPTIRNAATVKLAEEALAKVEGVERVIATPENHSLSVLFSAEGTLTSEQLIEELARGGINAENM